MYGVCSLFSNWYHAHSSKGMGCRRGWTGWERTAWQCPEGIVVVSWCSRVSSAMCSFKIKINVSYYKVWLSVDTEKVQDVVKGGKSSFSCHSNAETKRTLTVKEKCGNPCGNTFNNRLWYRPAKGLSFRKDMLLISQNRMWKTHHLVET